MTNDKKKKKVPKRPSLGSGMAEKAAKAIEARKRRIEDVIDEANGFKRNR